MVILATGCHYAKYHYAEYTIYTESLMASRRVSFMPCVLLFIVMQGQIYSECYVFLRIVYIGDVKRDIAPYLLTLANRNNPICVASPKVAMASTLVVTSVGVFARDIALNIANVNPTMPRVVMMSVVMLSV